MRNNIARLGIETLERRDNPSGWNFWEDTYAGAFLSGLGEGAKNIATGAYDTVVELGRTGRDYAEAALSGLWEGADNVIAGAYDAVVELGRTGRDLVTIYRNWDGIDPSRLESRLFQGAVQTAGDPRAAAAFDFHLVYGIVTLGIGPLDECLYNAVVSGDWTQFSRQAGGFGVMTLVPYAGVRGVNALPPVPVRVPVPQPSMVLQTVDGALLTLPGGVAWETVAVVSFALPAEASTAITVAAMSMTGPGGGGDSSQNSPSNFRELTEQAVQEEWALRGDPTAEAMRLVDLEGPKAIANPDPLLGPNQVRYQARFVNEFTGEVIDVSVNFDPTTGQFGTIKQASVK